MGDDNTFSITLDNDDIYGGASGSAVTSYDTNFTFDLSQAKKSPLRPTPH